MTGNIRWIPAAVPGGLWEGDLLEVNADGEEVLLVHLLDGTIKAYQGTCPHQGLPLADGDWNPESGVLICSGHLWEFDLATGAGLNPSGCRLREYPVRVDEHSIDIGIPTHEDTKEAAP